ncbi:hypothetical protein HY972_02240, partial [Candidatus Kaiserbacteria bacterium]|nr:hypothetical protein [Candidatus Kaiserbacteria bacterium]
MHVREGRAAFTCTHKTGGKVAISYHKNSFFGDAAKQESVDLPKNTPVKIAPVLPPGAYRAVVRDTQDAGMAILPILIAGNFGSIYNVVVHSSRTNTLSVVTATIASPRQGATVSVTLLADSKKCGDGTVPLNGAVAQIQVNSACQSGTIAAALKDASGNILDSVEQPFSVAEFGNVPPQLGAEKSLYFLIILTVLAAGAAITAYFLKKRSIIALVFLIGAAVSVTGASPAKAATIMFSEYNETVVVSAFTDQSSYSPGSAVGINVSWIAIPDSAYADPNGGNVAFLYGAAPFGTIAYPSTFYANWHVFQGGSGNTSTSFTAPFASGSAWYVVTLKSDYNGADGGWGVWDVQDMFIPYTIAYVITASAGAGGSISPSGPVSVTQGSSQSFTITPSSGYSISSVTVDDANQGAFGSYTFNNVNANHTISAAFTFPSPSGSISASPNPCTVQSGGSACTTSVNWSSSNATTPVVEIDSTLFSSALTGPQNAPWISPARSFTFNLRNNGISGTVLNSVTVNAVCTGGTSWNGSTCAPSASSCSATTIANCDLPLTPSGNTAGSCISGYTGTCNYSCTNTLWSPNSNSCTFSPSALGITVSPAAYSVTLPSSTITALYSLTNGNSANTTCRLLDWNGSPLTSYSPCTGGMSVTAPAAAAAYGYSIQANKSGETAQSNSFIVTVNPASASCTNQTVPWTVSGATCSGPTGVTANGSPVSVTSNNGNTGSGTFSCNGAANTYSYQGGGTCAAPAPAPTASLSATPDTINSGQSSTLKWSSTNATSCSFVGSPANGISTGGAAS